MVYESSYESGRTPFRPDATRGSWAAPKDFLIAGLGLAFKLDLFTLSWLYFPQMGIAAIVPYLLCLSLYVVPILTIQSFMGQFSSSGFISALRLSPIYKGMGFISLFLNLSILTYYSVFVALPLLFFIHSFRPTLPWSCEGTDFAALNLTTEFFICNATHSVESSVVDDQSNFTIDDANDTIYHSSYYRIPAELFFASQFGESYLANDVDYEKFTFSWQLAAYTILAWLIIAGIFYKFFNTAKFGTFLRYAICGTLLVLIVCVMRFLFLPGALEGLKEFFMPAPHNIAEGTFSIPLHVMTAFGAGWGTIITLASYNKFKTNIMRSSWLIAIGQMLIFLSFNLIIYLLEYHTIESIRAAEKDPDDYYYVKHDWMLYYYGANAISNLEFANMWSILYYGMLSSAGIIVLITQIHSVLTSIFDEFELLRLYKTEVTFTLIGIMSLFSLYFCSSDGIQYFTALTMDSALMQSVLNLLLLLVVLWIYGRERFQRDIEFMLAQPFSTCKVNMLRFIAPLCLLFTLFISFWLAFYEHMFTVLVIHIVAIFFFVLPWLFIPGYCVFSILQTTGSCCMRFKRCCRPTDWYPIEMEDRQRYEEAMGNIDITHQLQEVTPDVL